MPDDADNAATPLERLIQAHVEADHLFTTEQIRPMVRDFQLMQRDVEMLVGELYGDLRPTAANRNRRLGGLVDLMTRSAETQTAISQDVAYLKAAAENGGTRRKWGPGEWSVAAAFIILCGSVSAAIITAISRAIFGG